VAVTIFTSAVQEGDAGRWHRPFRQPGRANRRRMRTRSPSWKRGGRAFGLYFPAFIRLLRASSGHGHWHFSPLRCGNVPAQLRLTYKAVKIIEFWRRWHMTLSASCVTICTLRWGQPERACSTLHSIWLATMLAWADFAWRWLGPSYVGRLHRPLSGHQSCLASSAQGIGARLKRSTCQTLRRRHDANLSCVVIRPGCFSVPKISDVRHFSSSGYGWVNGG